MKIKIALGELSFTALSMPQEIPPTQFKLDDPEHNKAIAKKLLALRSQKLLWTKGDWSFYTTGIEKVKGAMFLTDGKSIGYFVRWETKKVRVAGKTIPAATQVAVWRDVTVIETNYLSRQVFFQDLLDKHGVLLSDTQQTERGKTFWLNRVAESFQEGNLVYIWDVGRRTLTKIDEISEFRTIVPKIWGKEKKYQMMRVIISKNEL